jgi:ABC transporter, permease/ATP-binding protein
MFTTLIKYIKQYKKDSLLTILFTVGEVVFETFIPISMALMIDKGISKGNMQAVYVYGILMTVLCILGLVSGIFSGKYAASASSGFTANLREGMFSHIQEFSFSNIDKFSTAGLVTRLTTDVTNVQNSYQMIIRLLMRAPATLIFCMIMTIVISPSLSLIFIFATLFLGFFMIIMIRTGMKSFTLVFDKYDELNASVQENVRGIRVVKSYVKENYEISKFDRAIGNLYKMFVKAEAGVALSNPLMLFTINISMLAISWFGANFIVAGKLTTGQLTSLYTYIMNMMMALMMLAFAFVMVVISEASAKRIHEVLQEKSDIISKEDAIKEVTNGSIIFENVCFSYKKESKKYVLENVNLDIESGQTIGIIGGTGSSKSSLVNLISRLYDVSKGKVKVGNIDVRDYDVDILRNKVAVVLQKNELFSGTILENLRWGNKNATLEECKRACDIACASEFIEKFPNGYDTYIEQGGSNVSGGQKQRLCIARAILKKPNIIIFDDSTSAVDTATDAKIRKALKEDLSNTTKIIIAQRISSIKEADKIIVMNEGKVDAFDTHENLLRYNEIYQSIAKVQLETAGDFDRKEGESNE